MKVMDFIRKTILGLGIIAAVLGAIYFRLFYTDERFEAMFGKYDENIIASAFVILITNLLCNLVYMIVTNLTIAKDIPFQFNQTAIVKELTSLVVTIAIAVVISDAIGLCLVTIPLGIMSYEIGNIIENNEVHEVELIIED